MAKAEGRFHPDNLVEGQMYKFWFQSASGKIVKETGKFRRMSVEGQMIMLWFDIDCGDINGVQEIPFESTAIHRAKEQL